MWHCSPEFDPNFFWHSWHSQGAIWLRRARLQTTLTCLWIVDFCSNNFLVSWHLRGLCFSSIPFSCRSSVICDCCFSKVATKCSVLKWFWKAILEKNLFRNLNILFRLVQCCLLQTKFWSLLALTCIRFSCRWLYKL